MLLAIPAPKRVSEIARLDKNFMQIINQGMTFYLPFISKTQKDCKSRELFYAIYQQNQTLCVVDCLLDYCERIKSFRDSDK